MWKNIEINLQNVEIRTERSVLIKIPNKSNYAGFKFWHPAKLVRSGSNSYSLSIGYNEEFSFRLFKNGNGKYNSKEIIDEITIGADEFEKAFITMHENISEKKEKSEFETHKPETIEAVENNLKEELLDD